MLANQGETIIQYVVMRRDLVKTLGWPVGALISQGVHASIAAVVKHIADPQVVEYTSDGQLERMHTITLEVRDEPHLHEVAGRLTGAGLQFHLWMEQPENIPTCLATKPSPRNMFGNILKDLKLFK
eukprot:c8153_g1_i4.p2 GENE.c8153_g1_i4~~c8153_g1_i4.p2  ORF type:complete len:126 (-),score=20.86 c8153_g1_i4:90-467(-)